MFYVYVLKSLVDGKNYVGATNNLIRRISEHNFGKTRSLKNRIPLICIYKEEFESRIEAFKREKYFKCGRGREELKKILNASARPSKADSI